MIRQSLLIVIGALAVAGCGSAASTRTVTRTQPTAAGSKPEACPQTLVLLNEQGQGAPSIVSKNATQATYERAMANAADLASSLKLLQDQTHDPAISTGITAEQDFQAAIRLQAAGNYGAAGADLTIVGPKLQDLVRQIEQIC